MFVFSSWAVVLLSVKSQGTGFGVKFSMIGQELPCLDVSGLYSLLWSSYYPSRVLDQQQGVGVDSLDLVLSIQLTPQPDPLQVLGGCGFPSGLFIGPIFHPSGIPANSFLRPAYVLSRVCSS